MRRLTSITTMSTAALAAALLVPAAGTAEARHRDTVREPLVRLALQLERDARDVSYRAEHGSHHATRAEYRALRRLDALEDEAREFRVALQRRGPWSNRVQREYVDVLEAHDRAERALYRAHARRSVQREFREMSRSLGRLDHALQRTTAAYRSGPRYHARVDRRGLARGAGAWVDYNGRLGNGDIRIRYVKREDDYDDDRHRSRRDRRGYDDDSWDDDSSSSDD